MTPDETKLLVRVDERTKGLVASVSKLEEKFDEYVTHHEFTPIRLIVFGFAGLILTSVIAAIVASVVKA